MSFEHDAATQARVSSRSRQKAMKIESIMKIESVRFREVPGELMNRHRTPVLYVHGRSLTQDIPSIEETLLVPQAHKEINTKLKPRLEVIPVGPKNSPPRHRGALRAQNPAGPPPRRAIFAHAPPGHCPEAFPYRHQRENTEMRRTELARARCPSRFQRTSPRKSRPGTLQFREWRPSCW